MTERNRRTGRVAGAVLNYGLGTYVLQLVNFLLIPVYTRFITPAEMGILEICVTAQVLAGALMRFGLPGSISRLYFDVGEGQQLRDLVTTISIAVVSVAAIFLAVGLVLGPVVFAQLLPRVPFHPYMDLALVGAFLQVAPDLQRRLLQARERSFLAAKLAAVGGATAVLLNVVFVIGLRMAARGVLLATLLSALVLAGIAWYLHRDDLRGHFRRQYLREGLHYGLPLVPHHVAAWANQFAGRWVLGGHATIAVLGQLSLAARVASPIGILTSAFSSAYSPVYFSWRSELSPELALAETRRVAHSVLLLGTVAVIGAATLGAWVIRHVMAPAYSPAAGLVGVIACALFAHLIYTLLSAELFFAKRTRQIATIFISSTVLNLSLVYLLVGRWGAFAAAAGQLLGGITSIVIVTMLASRTFPAPFQGRVAVTALLGAAAACVLPVLPLRFAPLTGLVVNVLVFAALAAAVLLGSGASAQLYSDLRSLLASRRVRDRADAADTEVAAV